MYFCNMILRTLENKIQAELYKGKAIILFGPRQAGKTTLVKSIAQLSGKQVKWLNGDESDVRDLFDHPSSERLKLIAGSAEILVIDEAQRIKNIGLAIKLLVDNYPEIQVIATGSSSFELANEMKEPLTGRKFEHFLFPISFAELANTSGLLEEKRLLNHRLIFGSYPDVLNNPGMENKTLSSLADSYLYKDILVWKSIKKPQALEKLLKALAFQIGSEVSYHELAQLSGLDSHTVENYIDILEKAFIVYKVNGLYRNMRNELKKSKKIYFFDNGIRNAIIANFNMPENRNDIGALWENYFFSERMKHTHYNDIFLNRYFWRSKTKQEIDLIEEREGMLFAYEVKWNPNASYRFPKAFTESYPDHRTEIVYTSNYDQFLGV